MTLSFLPLSFKVNKNPHLCTYQINVYFVISIKLILNLCPHYISNDVAILLKENNIWWLVDVVVRYLHDSCSCGDPTQQKKNRIEIKKNDDFGWNKKKVCWCRDILLAPQQLKMSVWLCSNVVQGKNFENEMKLELRMRVA